MVLRETTFRVGGILTIALGVLLASGLVWAGAGIEFSDAYLGAALAVGFGAFFMYVGSAETKERRAFLASVEPPGSESPRAPPPPHR
jgi:hypothetical protein